MERKQFEKSPEEKIKEKLEQNKKEPKPEEKPQPEQTQTQEESPQPEQDPEKAKKEAILLQKMIMEMQNTGLFRVNQLKLMKDNLDISVEFGNTLFSRLDEINKNLNRIANCLEGKNDGKKE